MKRIKYFLQVHKGWSKKNLTKLVFQFWRQNKQWKPISTFYPLKCMSITFQTKKTLPFYSICSPYSNHLKFGRVTSKSMANIVNKNCLEKKEKCSSGHYVAVGQSFPL